MFHETKQTNEEKKDSEISIIEMKGKEKIVKKYRCAMYVT